MKNMNYSRFAGLVCAGLLAAILTACNTAPPPEKNGAWNTPAPAKTAAPVVAAPSPAVALPTIRIKAGAEADFKDPKGVVWKADTGFDGGSIIDRPDLKVTGTDNPGIYTSEHYSMASWSAKVPNGKYTLRLHFSEDYDGIPNENGRIFHYTVKDGTAKEGTVVKEVKNFGPWKMSKAQYKAFVDTVPLTVANGQITIVFTAVEENPQINAIEITPQ